MPTPRTNCVGRRSCITSPMQKALRDILIERPYLYRCEMADFFYRRFRKRISERSIGWILRSTRWTRTTIHRIAQQRDADLRDHYLHGILKYKSYQLSLSMSPAAMEGLGIGAGVGLQRVLLQSRSQCSVVENDGTFFRHMRKMASY